MHKQNKTLATYYLTGNPIPEQLHDFKLIKVEAAGKAAIQKDWPKTQNYHYDEPRLLRHLKSGGNYGVIAGDAVIIDTDTAELQNIIQRLIGHKTFSVLTPGHGTRQFYLKVKWDSQRPRKTIPLLAHPNDPKTENIGHIKVRNSYALGPGSTHPNGRKYLVADNVPILEISEDQFKSIVQGLAPYIVNRAYDNEKQPSAENHFSGFDIVRIIPNLKEMRRHGNELQGPHPIHGSTTGSNFTVNPDKGVWHCFRCDSGGGPL
ncbi:MAG: bifunctional DNA primase/polymerase, partial [Candidatus Bathyarchaeia archaeon]